MSEEEARLPEPIFIIALATSAGGLFALTEVLSALPADLMAAIIVLQHMSPHHRSHLVDILSRRTKLKVKQAEHNDALASGIVYVAPPNRHLLIMPNGRLTFSLSEPMHFVRPSADPLFESLAQCYKKRAIAAVLTGMGRDGSDGIKMIKSCGGQVIAQDKDTSAFFGMPGAAIQTGLVDHILPLDKIAAFLENLVSKE